MKIAFYVALFIILYTIIGIVTGLIFAWYDSREYNVDVWEYLSDPVFIDESIHDFLVTLAFWPIFLTGFIFSTVIVGSIALLLCAIGELFVTTTKKIFTYIHDKKEAKKNANLG